MIRRRTRAEKFVQTGIVALLGGVLWLPGSAQDTSQPSGSPGIVKAVGTIKLIAGNTVTVASDSGSPMTVLIQDSTRMVRTEPGAKDLKSATPITAQDLQVGDRVLARGKMTDSGKDLLAATIIVIKAGDVAAKQQQEREDWQKRGTAGLVTAVDANGGTIVVSNSTMAGSKTTTIRVAKDTIIRRYAPDSVKFDDATPGTIDQVKIGDQLRARGTRSADGSEIVAEEIVSGTFRNIAGTVISSDAADNSVTVRDLSTKKPVTLKINADSQLRNLPPVVAQRIAARLKHPGNATGGAAPAQGAPSEARASEEAGSGGGLRRSGGAPDFQQILNRMPAVTLADLQKGAAVMVVATEGSASSQPTAVTLLTGVEDILTASPDSSRAAMLLSPWNLGGMDAAAANQ
ncbi:MAG TPA: hypothetical protein VEH30_05105 [Terriglobales bacterium]|nr:hypothetical protein [Terriglobales bacterium]